ncbi:A24 family peptidase, partial [Planctomycetota bacterium]|nr:A24 family peptidase [Planctomycetota bacterium]
MGVEQLFGLLSVVLLFATLIVATTTDLMRRKVYNWTTYPAICLGLALAFGAGGLDGSTASAGLWNHLAGLAIGFSIFFIAHWAGGGVGGGDVKLVAAVGAIGGAPFIIGAIVWAGLVGAAMAIWALLWRGKLLKGMKR